ncbi:MAG: hypothetical protein SGI88_14145 [Candidatus Hydrogenedentes bacterium]|nr:hypothetical protein [Candidatus Hydrogenedentota bacterium]
MCYSLYLSTNSDANLAQYNSELIRFGPLGERDYAYADLLAYPNRWYVGSKSVCSCAFRHAEETLGFGAPEDWFEEEDDDIAATKELYTVIKTLMSSGHKVDCVDTWEGVCPTQINFLEIQLADVPADAFRLFENYRFTFQ